MTDLQNGDTEWAPTNRVYYCEVHDSLVRKADVEAFWGEVPQVQCDWAIASHIPFVVEACTVEVFNLTRQSDAAFTPQGDTHKHKWTKITKGAGIGGWVCAECFAMTTTSPGDTHSQASSEPVTYEQLRKAADSPRLPCWHDYEDGHTCMMPKGHDGHHEPTSDHDIILSLS